MLHSPEYTAPTSVGLFKGKHNAVTSETEMEDPTLREWVMRWSAGLISIEGDNLSRVARTKEQIKKASLSFPGKVCEPPTTQVLDEFWGELPKEKSGKRKQEDVDSDAEQPKYPSNEEKQ
uniref:Uncharacterized protein n=1 Tax=Solanum tuberosum TaxID=4113 RepID=M1DNK4_SOLTU